MKVIIDSREQSLWTECNRINFYSGHSTCVSLAQGMLPLGDILFESDDGHPVLLIERKSMSDLLASIRDGRYKEQGCRLSCAREYPQHNVIYLIEGTMDSVSRDISSTERRKILSAMTSTQYFKGFSVVRTMSMAETAEYIIWTADKIERKFSEGILPFVYRWATVRDGEISGQNAPVLAEKYSTHESLDTGFSYSSVVKPIKKDNITPDNIGHLMLCTVPGVSPTIAVGIMAHPDVSGSVPALMTLLASDRASVLESISLSATSKRRVGPAVIQKLISLFIPGKEGTGTKCAKKNGPIKKGKVTRKEDQSKEDQSKKDQSEQIKRDDPIEPPATKQVKVSKLSKYKPNKKTPTGVSVVCMFGDEE